MGEGDQQQQTTEDSSTTSLKSLNQLSQTLQNLLNRFGLGPQVTCARSQNFYFSSDKTGPELHNRISQLRTSIERLRTCTNSIENINRSAEDQWAKIEDLRRQLIKKNEFFKRFGEEKVGEGGSSATTSQ
uniref:Mediator of RNA polymerase II transcription subunit 9 n=1 Tax=Meloidogyne hapla TaxID=6305 RepID=A0A1I8AYG2_MELHA